MDLNSVKELFSSWSIRILVLLLVVSIVHISINGIRWGIDFVGGVRLPVVLEKPIDKETMDLLINKIKTRTSGFGLAQVKVKAVGEDLIYVELPAGNEKEISIVEHLITKQGVFEGVVNGKVALTGDSILQDTIRIASSSELSSQRADWGVKINLDLKGAERFAEAAKGEANKQIYMMLDRPSNFLIVVNDSIFSNVSIGKSAILLALFDALKYGNDRSTFITYSQFNIDEYLKSNYSLLIIDREMNSSLGAELASKNITYNVVDSTMPVVVLQAADHAIVSEWKAIGILTSLTLSPEVTTGTPSRAGYVLTGSVQAPNAYERSVLGLQKAKEIVNILKSGSLPVKVTLGNKKYIPAPLGQKFLEYSLVALGMSLAFIAFIIAIRYRKLPIVIPVVVISLSETIILIAIMGTFTIDLAGIAGLIAAIGVSVDAQIVITDELLKVGKGRSIEDRLKRAFEIITMNVIVSVSTMLPLLFSGITEIIGFAVATIMGAVLGLALSRPAYSQLAKHLVVHEN